MAFVGGDLAIGKSGVLDRRRRLAEDEELRLLIDSLLHLYSESVDEVRASVVEYQNGHAEEASQETTGQGKTNDSGTETSAHPLAVLPALNRKRVPIALEKDQLSPKDRPLRFPQGIAVDSKGGRVFVSDTGNHRIIVLSLDGHCTGVIGDNTGANGLVDGDYKSARFHTPLGLSYNGSDKLYVADGENHCIRCVLLDEEKVTTVVGTGKRGYERRGGGKGTEWSISNPWDIACRGPEVYIAMAGTHQIWKYSEETQEVSLVSGSGSELNFNHPDDILKSAWAQPSGLSVVSTKQQSTLFVADAESSTVRAIHFEKARTYTETIVGGGLDPQDLFAFGDVDGVGTDARLQHPLGVVHGQCALHGKKKRSYVVASDTYNHRIKLVDPQKRSVSTIAGSGKAGLEDGVGTGAAFSEPSALDIWPSDEADPMIVICDTNNHALRLLHLNCCRVETLTVSDVPVPKPPSSESASLPAYLRLPHQRVSATLDIKPDDARGQLALRLIEPKGHHVSAGEWKIHQSEKSVLTFPAARGRLPAQSEDGVVCIDFDVKAMPFKENKKGAKKHREEVYVEVKAYLCGDTSEDEEEAGGVCRSDAILFVVDLQFKKAKRETRQAGDDGERDVPPHQIDLCYALRLEE